MSTRCLIGADTEVGTRLVYVHHDGYPRSRYGKLPTLARLVARDGLSRVVATLLSTPSGWSSFDGEPPAELPAFHADGRFELVPGYGVRYTLTPLDGYVQGDTEYTTPATAPDADFAYVYVLDTEGRVRWAENSGAAWDDLGWQQMTLADIEKLGSMDGAQ